MSSDVDYEKPKSKKLIKSTLCERMFARFAMLSMALLFIFSSMSVAMDEAAPSFNRLSSDSVQLTTLSHHKASALMLRGPANQVEEQETIGHAVQQSLHNPMESTEGLIPKDRMLVHNGELSFMTESGKCKSTVKTIEDIVSTEGGYVESKEAHSEEYSHFINDKEGKRMRLIGSRDLVILMIRVPSDKFHKILATLQDLVDSVRVKNLSTSSRDVTDSYVDAASRAATLETSRSALQTLLTKADTVKEVMEVQRELNTLTQDYESMKARAISLQKQSSMSNLQLILTEEKILDEPEPKVHIPDRPRFSPMRPIRTACEDVLSILLASIDIFAYASVVAIAVAVVCLLGYLIYGLCLNFGMLLDERGCMPAPESVPSLSFTRHITKPGDYYMGRS